MCIVRLIAMTYKRTKTYNVLSSWLFKHNYLVLNVPTLRWNEHDISLRIPQQAGFETARQVATLVNRLNYMLS